MGSLTALLNLSRNALETSQDAIDITSNNVANANTLGYSEEVATWRENDSVTLGARSCVGQGASVSAVSQRDTVLNQRVQQQTQLVSSTSAESAALTNLQSVFGITSTSSTVLSTAIGTDINAFFNSFSALQASPSDSSVRQGVLSAAQTLASDFNGASNQIAQQASALNQQVTGAVAEVNSLTSSIAALNLQIESASASADAGTLEDQRQQALTQLSQYIGFDQTKTENNGLTLTTVNGAVLVSKGQSSALGTWLVNGNVNVVSDAGQDVTSGLTGGSLGGLLRAREQDLPTVSSALDSLAYAIGSAVNEQNAAGLDGKGNPAGALFSLPATSTGAASAISLASTDPNSLAAAAVGEGPTGNSNATALSGLTNTAQVNGQAAAEFYASFLTKLGSTAARVSDENTTQRASLTQLTTQQGAGSRVSLDQEAANLTLYERSYDAAAKVFTIVDQLMASALNLGEQTTVA